MGHVVWIAEEPDGSLWSGRFSARCQGSECRGAKSRGPQGVSADEAIAWARGHARLVFIRPGDSSHYYSAGDQAGSAGRDQITPLWPAEGRLVTRRRMAGLEYLDRTALDPPIAWDVTIVTRQPNAAVEDAFVGGVAGAVGGLGVTREANAVKLAFEIDGRVIEEAPEGAAAIVESALRAAVANVDAPAPFGWQFSVSVEPAAGSGAGTDS